MGRKTKVEITDEDKNVVATHFIKNLSVRDSIKLNEFVASLNADGDEGEEIKENTLLSKGYEISSFALSLTLCDKEGNLTHPDHESVMDLDLDVFNNLCVAYREVNPNNNTLETKKKKF